MASRTLVIKTKMDNTEYTAQIKQLERELETLKKSADESSLAPEFRRSEREAQNLQAEIEKTTNKLQKLKLKQQELDSQDTFEGMSNSIDNVGKGLTNTISKVGRWALALFGIRTALSLITQATSIVSENNEDVANQIESIKYTLAMAIEPVIKRIISWVQTLLQYVQYLVKAWTGKDIFANAKNNMKATEKSAKNVKNSLAGFDEMNTVSDTSTSSDTSSGGIGTIEPLGEGEVPEWLKWISENGSTVVAIISGLTAGIIALKLGLGGIMGLGLGLIIGGIVALVKSIVDYIKDPSWENFEKILIAVGVISAGILLIFGGIPALIALIIGLVVALGLAIYKHWEEVKETLGKIGSWIYDNVITPVVDFFTACFDTIWSVIKLWWSYVQALFTIVATVISTPFKTAYETITRIFSDIFNVIKKIVDGIKKIFSGDLKGALNSFKSAFKSFADMLWTIASTPLRLIANGINGLIDGVNKIKFDVPNWVPVIGGKTWGFNIPKLPKLAQGGIVNNPGHGVNMGSYIAGEKGQEAVLPLTNSQTMQELGEAIGKYITINANITNSMNGRVISRELQKINNDNNFAYNR